MKGTFSSVSLVATGMLFSLPRLRSSSAKSGFSRAIDDSAWLTDAAVPTWRAPSSSRITSAAIAMIRLSSTISAVPDRRGGADLSASTLVATPVMAVTIST